LSEAKNSEMKLTDLDLDCAQMPGAVPAWHAVADEAGWLAAFERIAEEGGRIVALWGSERPAQASAAFAVHAALVQPAGLLIVTLPLRGDEYPDAASVFPSASRMQRATFDLLGLRARGAADTRKWLRHAAWPADVFPLRAALARGAPPPKAAPAPDAYPFVTVAGDGVHEIPVGPVHAGTIEPGHFRFSVVGERVVRLEERLGYKHKGVEKRFAGMSISEGALLAGRISCDSTAAYAWAFAMAAESACGVAPPARALWLRALLLERERIANHLGDLGFLGNDAGLAFGLSQFSMLKEDVLRLNRELFGHRHLMDAIVPGGVSVDLDAAEGARILEQCDAVEREVTTLRGIYDEHPGLQDRFITCGRVSPSLAARLGLIGLAGRASAQAWDLRTQYPCAPYDALEVQMATHGNGDVAARVSVRFDEIFESLRIIRAVLENIAPGDTLWALPVPQQGMIGVGWVEGWRGEVFVWLEAGADGALARVHPHDPSWHNWPVLEHAVLGNIVPDFPLINKSFNLSYSGHDL
jgi:Ni,Fe-hydrogenase III large subunit/Ni,Fe-hydrogenase III component G